MSKRNIYFIHGEDRFRLSCELKNLKQKLLTKDTVFVKAYYTDDLQSILFGLSLFAEKKLLQLDLDTEDLDTEKLLKLHETNELSEQIQVIFCNFGKIDKRLKLIKFLEKNAIERIEINEFSPWKPQETINWLSHHCKNSNIKINKLAAEKLVEFYGNNTAIIYSELEKLYCYRGGEEIKIDDVMALCASVNNMFDLADMLLYGKFAEFSRVSQKLFLYQNPLQIIAGLQTVFRGYLAVKSLQTEKLPSGEIAKLTGKNPWKIGEDMKKLQNIDFNYIYKINKTINKIEEDIKTGGCSDANLHFRFKVLSIQLYSKS